jgi:anti-anti-sigma regulatory factor
MLTTRTYGSRIALEGSIDDAANVLAVLDHAKNHQLALDLGGVRFINSIGVREWIRLLAAAAKQKTSLALHRVAVVVVHQMNLVPAARTAQIVSFLAPYICEECDAEREFELTPAGPKEPPRQCVECKSAMVLRDPASIYFAFLQA